MWTLGALGFTAPLLLAALIALPVLWWLLRATPPAPVRRRFPGVSLLLGLEDPERMPARTPWWLLLLRMLAVAFAIIGLAGPVLNPAAEAEGDGPLLILMDGGWGSAPDWPTRQAEVGTLLDQAARSGRPVHLVSLSDADPDLEPRPAEDWANRLETLQPQAWAPDRARFAEVVENDALEFGQTVWLSDGLGAEDGLADALLARGPVRVVPPLREPMALSPLRFEDGQLLTTVLRAEAGGAGSTTVNVIGADTTGTERVLDAVPVVLPAGETEVEVAIDLPLEVRNRVLRVALQGIDASAGAVALADDGLKRRRVALVAGAQRQEGLRLTAPLHYLRSALDPIADVVEPPLADVLDTNPDVIMLADVAALSSLETTELTEWVENGGLLVRFAGPRLAASGLGQTVRDPLLPVRLRAGGRSVGGTMSWGAPKRLRPFPAGTLFDGLTPPEEVEITSQVMAQPDPDLAERTLAALEDGTPLVTARDVDRGRVILFHVTATTSWSSLPLSGLFLDMLERIVRTAQAGEDAGEALAGAVWAADQVLDGYGQLGPARGLSGVEGERLAQEPVGPDAPPGYYVAGERRAAINVMSAASEMVALDLPSGVAVTGFTERAERDLKSAALTIAVLLLLTDILATLALGGRLRPAARAGLGVVLALVLLPGTARAQEEEESEALYAATETVLAYVETGDGEVDRISRAGLTGLSVTLTRRTAVEPAPPVGVNVEEDELAFFPLLYWPVTEVQSPPSPDAVERLNTYLRGGGMILFDTRDAHLASRSGGPNGALLQRLADGLDLPPLEPVPDDHVINRSFYLLEQLPGRHVGPPVWVEASLAPQEVEGVPFRTLNDGVSPVLIGANDWAGAWAMDEQGNFIRPVGRGVGGERQREIALRFGVNLVMYVMTGNYKSDQVHVPALLERLGQ